MAITRMALQINHGKALLGEFGAFIGVWFFDELLVRIYFGWEDLGDLSVGRGQKAKLICCLWACSAGLFISQSGT
jgi:hypothetical protein